MNIISFVGLFALLSVPACQGLGTLEFAKKCIEEYKTVLANYKSDEGTCTRLQILIDCLSKRRELQSQMVDAMRYFAVQNGIFLSKLKLCPDIDFKDLKETIDKTDFGKQHKYLDKIENDEADQCAVEVYKKCRRGFLVIFASNHKICDDVSLGINCITKEVKDTGCDANIIKHFQKMLEVVGGLMIREVRRYAGIECASDIPE